MPLVDLRAVTKRYVMGESVVSALDGVTLSIDEGEFVAVTGRSGSGKSTLLQLIGGLDRPTGGKILVGARDLGEQSDDALADFRLQTVGFVFQFFHLFPGWTALENVSTPLLLAGRSRSERESRARALLEQVGLGTRMGHRPEELSGGEQQRVAIARALAHDAPLLLADEPTGNLDSKTTTEILDFLGRLHQGGKTVVIVTHDPAIAAERARRTIELRDGKVVRDEKR